MSGATIRITARRLPARGTSTIDGTAQQIASTVHARPRNGFSRDIMYPTSAVTLPYESTRNCDQKRYIQNRAAATRTFDRSRLRAGDKAAARFPRFQVASVARAAIPA